jgi:ankyrin repeat protein
MFYYGINTQNFLLTYLPRQKGYFSIIKQLVDAGANVNAATAKGATPVYVAAQKGWLGITEFLVDHGADINVVFQNGFTPLHIGTISLDIVCLSCR